MLSDHNPVAARKQARRDDFDYRYRAQVQLIIVNPTDVSGGSWVYFNSFG